jgi:hypothetical protein
MKKHWKQLAKEIIEKGQDLLNWACDMGIDGRIQSNGSQEHLYYYDNNYYIIRTPFFANRALSLCRINQKEEIENETFIADEIYEFKRSIK